MTAPTVSASAWFAAAFLRVARRVRAFNAAQVELHERWWRRHGWPVASTRPG